MQIVKASDAAAPNELLAATSRYPCAVVGAPERRKKIARKYLTATLAMFGGEAFACGRFMFDVANLLRTTSHDKGSTSLHRSLGFHR
jgi:hypothetical protein